MGGRVLWQRLRAWMLVFSSADITNSSSCRGVSSHTRAYRSRMRPALAANCGSRGKIQHLCCQGRMASSCNHRHTVLSLMVAAIPLLRTSRAISGVLQRERGTPELAGSSQASAFTCTTTSGGERPGTTRPFSVIEASHSLLEKPFSPEANDFATRVQALGNFIVCQSLSRKKNDLGPLHLKIRQRIFSRSVGEFVRFFWRQHDFIWAFSWHIYSTSLLRTCPRFTDSSNYNTFV